MALVYLSIGSNIDKQNNILSCMKQLAQDFPGIVFSKTYETEAVGFEGDNFYNLTAVLETSLTYSQASQHFKAIELNHARARKSAKFTSRTLDIDILLYDDLILQPDQDLPRAEITEYSFVLFPLAEIAPDTIHPIHKKSIRQLAEASTLDSDTLIPVQL